LHNLNKLFNYSKYELFNQHCLLPTNYLSINILTLLASLSFFRPFLPSFRGSSVSKQGRSQRVCFDCEGKLQLREGFECVCTTEIGY
jgi:hypothetical protein